MSKGFQTNVSAWVLKIPPTKKSRYLGIYVLDAVRSSFNDYYKFGEISFSADCLWILCFYHSWFTQSIQTIGGSMTLKLKTIHKCLVCPYKRQSSMLCFIAFKYSRIPVSHDADKACNREGYITQTTNILRIQCHVLALSPHNIWHDLFVFQS